MNGVARRRLALVPRQWFIIAFTLSLIVLLSAWVFVHPDLWLYDCEYRYLPSMEGRLGFKGARIVVPGAGYEPWALVQVEPTGVLGRAGFRAGDIPIAHHGGFSDFCGAMHSAEDGHSPQVTVRNAESYESGQRRSLRIPTMSSMAVQQ